MKRFPCPVCSTEMTAFAEDIRRCPSCRYYRSAFAAGSGTGIEGLETLRRANFETILDRLESYQQLKGLRLLEVGCAKGWFLEAAAKRGVCVTGIEPEEANQRIAAAKGFDVRLALFPEAAAGTGPFDIIAFNDVFEHLPDPAAAIKAAADLLVPGGFAAMNIPSSYGILFRLARAARRLGFEAPWDRLWQKGLPSPHISYFDAVNLIQLAERTTRLREREVVRLKSMTRKGLRARVKSANPGMAGEVMLGAVWGLSYLTDILPSDITLVLLEKRG